MAEQVVTSNMQQHATVEHANEIKRKEKEKWKTHLKLS
jgi:hypothetical protein